MEGPPSFMTPNAYHLRCTTVNSYLFSLSYMCILARRSVAFEGGRPSGAPPRRKAVIDGSPAGSGCESNATEEPPITSDMMYLRAFVEKTPTRYFARHDRLRRRTADGAGGGPPRPARRTAS